MKVAILTCLKACQVCTGASCLAAWNSRTEQADHSRCPRIQNIVEQLEAQGVIIVEGTH